VRSRTVSTEAAKTSFQEMTKAKMAVAAIPGRASGSTILRKAWKRVQPNTHAASSSSRGMPMNRLEEMSAAKGRASAVWMRATPNGVS
jgi:hypothetical protein